MDIKEYIIQQIQKPHIGWDGNTYILVPEEQGDKNEI